MRRQIIAIDLPIPNWQNAVVRLTAWNDIPAGFGARFEVQQAPVWLRVLYATPFLDRFAYLALVCRGLGVLSPHTGWSDRDRVAVTGGWRVDDGTVQQPGAVSPLVPRRRP